MLCRYANGKRLLRVPTFWQNPSRRGAKIFGNLVQNVYSQGILAVRSYLRTFSGSDTRASGFQLCIYMYDINAVYGCLAISESGGPSIYGPSQGSFPQSRFRRVRKLRARLETCARTSAGNSFRYLTGHFFQFKCNLRVLWVPEHDNPLIFIATVMVLYFILIFMEVKINS